jgi:hypothetical protein
MAMTQLIVWLNSAANRCAAILLAPVAWLPGWVSATAIAVGTGVLMLLIFKVTSHQSAIKRTRNQIKANLLALSLFKDNVWVGLRAQGRILVYAGRLMLLAVVPMLIMTLPMVLVLGQLALWYQARPLHLGEEAVVAVHLRSDAPIALDEVQLSASEAAQATIGPVRVPSKEMVCWNVRAAKTGVHELVFSIDGESFTKQLAVGDSFMPTSLERPAWHWSDVVLHPREAPFAADSLVQSIEVAYPERDSWTSGSDAWLVYWFAMSLVAAFAARPLLKVNI